MLRPWLISVCLVSVGAPLFSQSLGEIAEREKQRRAALQHNGASPSRSFSDESLQKAPEGWRLFKDAKLGFQVSLPVAPERLDEADIMGATRIPRVRFVARSGPDTFSVIVKDRPKDPNLGPGTLLSRMQTEARLDLGGQVTGVALRDVVWGVPGADFTVITQRDAKDFNVTCRAFVGPRHLYLLVADCCGQPPPEGEGAPTAMFLDSFVVDQGPPAR